RRHRRNRGRVGDRPDRHRQQRQEPNRHPAQPPRHEFRIRCAQLRPEQQHRPHLRDDSSPTTEQDSEHCFTVLLPSIYLPSIYLPSIYLPSLYLPSIYLPSIYLPSIYLPSIYLPSIYLPSIYLPSPYLPSVSRFT